MYKLSNILSEIKIIKNVTPEMIEQLYEDIWNNGDENKWYHLPQSIKTDWYISAMRGIKKGSSLTNIKEDNYSPQELYKIYNDILNFRKKHNL